MKLVIVGAGEIGQALAEVAKKNKCEVCFWDVDPKKCSASSFTEVLNGVGVVLFAVPSSALQKTIQETNNLVSKDIPFLVITKGLDPETGETPAEILEKLRRPVAFLGGPLLAEEVINGSGGFMVVAGSEKVWGVVKKIFEWGNLRVHGESDIFGVATAGVLKNFYAFLIGVASGVGLGENLQAEIFSAGVSEMTRVLPRFGGDPQTAWGAAGMGDMHATAFSKYSRNRMAGESLVKDGKLDERAESVRTWPVLRGRLGRVEGLPLLNFVGLLMEGRARPEEIKKILG